MPQPEYCAPCAQSLKVTPPSYALKALEILEAAGWEAWIVGGWVRDALMNRPCSDIDIATNSSWQTTRCLFEQKGYSTHETGIAHGTLSVFIEKHLIEITTYRIDGAYLDARHPQQVQFVRTIQEDLARRDFTINALAYHPIRGTFDPYHGWADIQHGVIRAVGNPSVRFAEDSLRILRGCRFASQLGFAIEPHTLNGMLAHKKLLLCVSAERITHELNLFLLGSSVKNAFLQTSDILTVALPELIAPKNTGSDDPPYTSSTIDHTAQMIEGVPPCPRLRWAALLCDLYGPAGSCADESHSPHPDHALEPDILVAKRILARLSLSKKLSEDILTLIKYHDKIIEASPLAVKRLLKELQGDTSLFHALCDLQRSSAESHNPRRIDRIKEINNIESIANNIVDNKDAFTIKHLAIKGCQVIEAGVQPGPPIGEALEASLEAVMNGFVENETDDLQEFIRNWIRIS